MLSRAPLRRTAFWVAPLLALALAGCGSAGPPSELSGLWSAGPAACAAGMGVRFDGDAIEAIYDSNQRQTLFEHPRYQLEASGKEFRVRITYALPVQPGGASSAGAYGVLVLTRDGEGVLRPS